MKLEPKIIESRHDREHKRPKIIWLTGCSEEFDLDQFTKIWLKSTAQKDNSIHTVKFENRYQ